MEVKRLINDFGAGGLSDFYSFDLDLMLWANLTDSMTGSSPSPRAGMGITAFSGRIYIFGGTPLTNGGAPVAS